MWEVYAEGQLNDGDSKARMEGVDDETTVVFFFQAEDGIRDYKVTGVQTCALPILLNSSLVSGGCGGLGFNSQAEWSIFQSRGT